MKKLTINFDGITDTTGYLFSFAKSLSAALRCSQYCDFANDIIATSGFAFRMWIDPKELCPSATSIWEFKKQQPWAANGGLRCSYTERLWGEESIEESRRLQAIKQIEDSIDNDVAAIAWDISGGEWGLIIGYDASAKIFYILKTNGTEDQIPYEKLGQLGIPILSVLTITGVSPKFSEELVSDTKRLAASHLRGEEWCDNAKGLEAYDALIQFIETKLTADTLWNLEYMLGTYAALKYHAWKFFEKYQEDELAVLYQEIHQAWQSAFDLIKNDDLFERKTDLILLLQKAQSAETAASDLLSD